MELLNCMSREALYYIQLTKLIYYSTALIISLPIIIMNVSIQELRNLSFIRYITYLQFSNFCYTIIGIYISAVFIGNAQYQLSKTAIYFEFSLFDSNFVWNFIVFWVLYSHF